MLLRIGAFWAAMLGCVFSCHAQHTYHVSSTGDDALSGLSPTSAWQTLDPLNAQTFVPGDSILFERGGTWLGMFHLKGSGTEGAAIVVGSYGDHTQPRPILDGDGYQASLLIYNDSHIVVQDMVFTNQTSHLDDNGEVKKLPTFLGETNDWGSGKNVRFGIKIVADAATVKGLVFRDVKLHDIYPTPTNPDNAHLGYGIKLESRSDTLNGQIHTIDDVLVTGVEFTRTGHYGMWIKPLGLAGNNTIKHENIHITGCTFTHTGGSGFVPNRSRHVVVEHCLFNHTGSSVDDRMWARGSGTWPFKCERVVIQHNRLMNAHGPQDSYSAHIDYGCKDVVIQYNLSFNNEGGFAEILGDNVNCGYRYNISVNDGYREDPDEQPWNKKGKIFWLSTFCGNNQVRCPSQGSFFYNNTVYVDESINPEIYVWPDAGDVLICNNLVSMAAGGEVLPTLLEDEGNVFNVSHNLFHPPARIDLDSDLLTNALYLPPQFLATSDAPIQSELNYQPSPSSPTLGNGVLISGNEDPWDFLHNNGGQDFFGLPVSGTTTPTIGALQGSLCAEGTFWNTSTNQCESDLEACPEDLDGDGTVSVFDLLMLLTALPTTC